MGKKRSLKDSDDVNLNKEEGKIKKAKKQKIPRDGKRGKDSLQPLPFDHKYIVAPMVGASELPFRILCRKYGAQLVYTPMIIASQFATSQEYREKEFQTTPFDRPLVCHFAANDPKEFAQAAKLAEPHCDAIDLNLGCPQRTAYVGHFGSYLMDKKDRSLVLSIVKAGVKAVNIPVFVKIRLMDTPEDTKELVQQLYDAGASLVAVHGRYRATFHRKGAGARDGPALLDQIKELKETFQERRMITNGNTVTYDDVVNNLQLTTADGIMSAEGILDNPALYLPRWGSREDDMDTLVPVKGGAVLAELPRKQKLLAKLRKAQKLEDKISKDPNSELTEKQKKTLSKKSKVLTKLKKIDQDVCSKVGNDAISKARLGDLFEASDDKPKLVLEYLNLARQYPTMMRTVIFHTRRMLKTELATYQLMQECLACTSIDAVEALVTKIQGYQEDPQSFQFDKEKARKEKEALERKKQEEGKRKAYEARMIRKAKREGKADLEFYLRQGSVVPTLETVQELKELGREEQLRLWKEREHSQHCMAFHLAGECPRARSCAFLHVASATSTTFDEGNEVAG